MDFRAELASWITEDPATGCRLMKRSSRFRLNGGKVRMAPWAVEQQYGVSLALSSSQRLKVFPACGTPACVSPFHLALKAPYRALLATVPAREERWALIALVRGAARREPHERLGWDPVQVAALGISPALVDKLSSGLSLPRLSVLAAWSYLVRQEIKRRKRHDPIGS